MLVLSREKDQSIMVGENVEISVVDIRGDKVRLGITSPKEIPVHRREVYEAIQRERAEQALKEKKSEIEVKASINCKGPYGSNKLNQDAYLRVSESGEKKLECDALDSLDSNGFCYLGNPTGPLKKCLFGIEKFC